VSDRVLVLPRLGNASGGPGSPIPVGIRAYARARVEVIKALAEWTPERLQRQALGIGPNTEALIIAVMARRPHPEQGFRTCLGVLRLFRGIDAARAEAVSLRAVEIGALTYASVASILKHRLDRSASPQAADGTPLLHANIRGPRYYH
jgi:transposase